MKLDVITPENTVIKSDDFDSIEYTIAEGQGKLLFNILSQYSNPIGSLVREVTTNAFDSHIEAGVDIPVDVGITQSTLVKSNSVFYVTDYGMGLSPDRVKEIYSKFLASTKRDSNEQHGAFGLGSKSPLSYCDMFYVITVYDLVRYTYIISKGQQAPEINLISKEITSDENGTTIEVPISAGDIPTFRKEVKRQLQYFDNINYYNCGVQNNYKIYRGEHFLYKHDNNESYADNYIHIALGKVYYPLDYNSISSIRQWTSDIPIALRFDIGDLPVVWNRENIEYTSDAIRKIEEKIRLAKEEMQELWDKQHSNITSMKEYVGFCKDVKLNRLHIDDDVYIPGIKSFIYQKVGYPKYNEKGLEDLPTHPLFDFKIKRSVVNGAVSQRRISKSFFNMIEKGHKDNLYIYNGKTKSTKNKYIDRVLNQPKFYLIAQENDIDDDIPSNIYYHFNVDHSNRDRMKDVINEFRREVVEYVRSEFPIYEDVVVTEEFKNILKEERKEERIDSSSTRQVEKITDLAAVYVEITGEPDRCDLTFSRGRFDLTRNRYMYIYGVRENSDNLLLAYSLVSQNDNIRVVKVAQNKAHLFASLDNSIEVNAFLSSNHKLLQKAITSRKVKEILDNSMEIFYSYKVRDALPKEMFDAYSYIKNNTKWMPHYTYSIAKRLNKYCDSREDLIDNRLIYEAENLETYYQRHPLLYVLHLNSYKFHQIKAGLKQYLKPSHINAYLLNRLFNLKKEDNND